MGITLHDEDLPTIRDKKVSIRILGRFLTTAQTINKSLSLETLLYNTQFEDIVKKVPVHEGTRCRSRSVFGFDLKNLIKRQLEKLRMLPSADQRDLKLKGLELLSHNLGEPWTIRVNSEVYHYIAEIGRNQRQELVKCEDVTEVFNYATSQMKILLSVFKLIDGWMIVSMIDTTYYLNFHLFKNPFYYPTIHLNIHPTIHNKMKCIKNKNSLIQKRR